MKTIKTINSYWLSLIFIFPIIWKISHGNTCPCDFPDNKARKNRDSNLSKSAPNGDIFNNSSYSMTGMRICSDATSANLLSSYISTPVLTKETFHISQSPSSSTDQNCDVWLFASEAKPVRSRIICPEICSPVPAATVHMPTLSGLHSSEFSEDEDVLLSCSLTLSSLKREWNKRQTRLIQKHGTIQRYLIHELVMRRFYECHETAALHKFASLTERKSSVRMHVKGMVIWIGSKNRRSIIESQAIMLNGLPMIGHDKAVIAWAATDELYPCADQSTKCLGSNKRYGGFLTSSAVNYMSSGWGCAQRRPLRALSHVLLLYEPDFVILLDDDTLFNYPLFEKRYLGYVQDTLRASPVYIGESLGKTGDKGHLSKVGMFIGGSGYVLGKALLELLVKREIQNVCSDSYRSVAHVSLLSVLKEGAEMSAKHCSTRQCILTDPSAAISQQTIGASGSGTCNSTSSAAVSISIRLIDFCANLMANEHTCQHSDHSVGRCMLYGAAAIPHSVVCQQLDSNLALAADKAKVPLLGMCFTTPTCDLSQHVTCHRYSASASADGQIQPVRMTKDKGHYKYFSSFLNGTVADTFLG